MKEDYVLIIVMMIMSEYNGGNVAMMVMSDGRNQS